MSITKEEGPSIKQIANNEDDDEIEEELISEQISSKDGSIPTDSDPKIMPDLQAQKRRQLFEIESSEFGNLDDKLSGAALADHFKVGDDILSGNHPSQNVAPQPSVAKSKNSKNSKKSSKQKSKDISPFRNEDNIVLINDDKISLEELKRRGSADEPNSQSTTNDISDIQEDESEPNVRERQTHSHEAHVEHSLEVTQPIFNSLDLNVLQRSVSNGDAQNESSIKDFGNLSSLDPLIDIDNEEQINKILDGVEIKPHEVEGNFEPKNVIPIEPVIEIKTASKIESKSVAQVEVENSSSLSSDGILNLRDKLEHQSQEQKISKVRLPRDCSFDDAEENTVTDVKPMERLEDAKEVLEDISEVSETSDDTTLDKIHVYSVENAKGRAIEKGKELREIFEKNVEKPESISVDQSGDNTLDEKEQVVNLNMIETLETQVKELHEVVSGKDISLSALSMQLGALSHRDSLKDQQKDSLRDIPNSSGRESTTTTTTSTEYKGYQEDLVKLFDFHGEIQERDNIINDLTKSLKESVDSRQRLQDDGSRLANEVAMLRKQLADTVELIKRPRSSRMDHESQRISDISIDLVSESEEDVDRIPTDYEDNRSNRNSRERQYEYNLDLEHASSTSKQIEIFQKYLSTEELRIFFMVQKKFDDMLSEELEKNKGKHDQEMKIVIDQLESEKSRSKEMQMLHEKEVEELRKYFEGKCVELEKQYSEDIFSQHSKRHSNDTSSDMSEHEFPEEVVKGVVEKNSPKRVKGKELYASPTHRKITPTSIGKKTANEDDKDPEQTVDEIKDFYQNKINEICKSHETAVKKLSEKLKRFESHQADDEFMHPANESCTASHLELLKDVTNNDAQLVELTEIVAEYESRLQQQVAMAKADIIHELEIQIQALLSETSIDDSHWPPELILLREKFTAKSQLEIAQLQIKHKDEMAKMKSDFEKQINRKLRRNSTFDQSRDLNQIVSERDNLRELSNTFRCLLSELAKSVSNCEDDANQTINDELRRNGILQTSLKDDLDQMNISTASKWLKSVPDVSGILTLIEDPSFIGYISQSTDVSEIDKFNLMECLDKLKNEAEYLLVMSENLRKIQSEKSGDSCEEEDGLKSKTKRSYSCVESSPTKKDESGASLPAMPLNDQIGNNTSISTGGEIGLQLNDLRNRLAKSENDRIAIQEQLVVMIKRNDDLTQELVVLREHLEHNKEDYSEGYGISQLQSPSRQPKNAVTSFTQLQDRARNVLNASPNNTVDSTTVLLQLVEDFCREGERFVDEGKKDKDDLQAQFKGKENEIKELCSRLEAQEENNEKLNSDLKASIDKIYVLRDIISGLENEVEERTNNEQVLVEKIKELESFLSTQNRANESLQQEMESFKNEATPVFQDKINQLEEQLKNARPSAEQSLIFTQISEQLKDIEDTLDRKTKTLEQLHSAVCSESCSSPSEDVSISVKGQKKLPIEISSPRTTQMDDVARIAEKLAKHTRAEGAAIKRIQDLEMQIHGLRAGCTELQHERDILQDRMTEQLTRISTLQTRLDEQRHRAEELHRQGTSDLTVRVHDLQSELSNLKETLVSREKQIATLRSHLEQSKEIIDKQESELASGVNDNRFLKLESELKQQIDENQRLKEKMKNDMINKLALPDLMETMLADKNEEMDHLRDQLLARETELRELLAKGQQESGKVSARTLSDVVSISDYDEPDVDRHAAVSAHNDVIRMEMQTMDSPKYFSRLETPEVQASNEATAGSSFQQPIPEPSFFQSNLSSIHPGDGTNSSQFSIIPRKIHFSLESPLETPHLQRESAFIEEIVEEDEDREENKKETDVEAGKSELVRLKLSIESLQQENGNLKADLESIRIQLSDKTDTLNKLTEEKHALKSQLQSVQENVVGKMSRTLENEQKERAKLVEDLTRKENELKEYNRSTSQEVTELKIINEELRTKWEQQNSRNNEFNDNGKLILQLEREINELKLNLKQKNELLSKKDKEAINYAANEAKYLSRLNEMEAEVQKLQNEMSITKEELSEKLINYEKCQLYMQELEVELVRYKEHHQTTSRPFSLEEMEEKVEKELNYSAQLDSNILKAIESDELSSDDDNNMNKQQNDEIAVLRQTLEREQSNCVRLQALLDGEKKNSSSIQHQDASIIEAIRTRLEAALDSEAALQKQLDEERDKVDRLTTQFVVLQRSKSRENSMLQMKSPTESPRKSTLDSEQIGRLQSEIKLLQSQNERERERVDDLKKVVEREKDRFVKELDEQREYGTKIKKEMDRLIADKQLIENDYEHAQERLQLNAKEIESLEARISNLQEVESRRLHRRKVDPTELQEHKKKLTDVEREKGELLSTIQLLRGDLERSAQREIRLTQTLEKDLSGNSQVPEQFLQKLKEMNTLLLDNSRENRQLAETLHFLTEERRGLQKRVYELESTAGTTCNCQELEERANHLFGKYLKVESFRKSLVHQKRYLLIALQSYQDNEARALQMLNVNHAERAKKKRKSFRTIVLTVIAVERMKFIMKRWQSGKRIGAHSLFSRNHQHILPRRSASASTNHWTTSIQPLSRQHITSQSPPCRLRTASSLNSLNGNNRSNLQAPALIAECSERLENLAAASSHWS